MARAISARRKGDEYQARFAWIQLLKMRTDDFIHSVTFESDEISFVDDVIVVYKPFIKDHNTGDQVNYDFFQCKKHVTEAGSFSVDNLLNPSFINSKNSMLARLLTAYNELKKQNITFRLNIVSNWAWHPDDLLTQHVSEGRIRNTFFEGKTNSKLGKLRKKFIDHLNVDEKELELFIKVLRFDLGKTLYDFQEAMQPLLKLSSLKQIDLQTSISIYDDLIWKWFAQDINTFSKSSLQKLLEEEKLTIRESILHSEISVQTFRQFARKPDDVLNAHLDLTNYFHDRYILDENDWQTKIYDKVSSFLKDVLIKNLSKPIHIYFDCHLSVSFLIGYLINPKYGIPVVPIHKNYKTGYDLWEIPSTSTNYNWLHELSNNIYNEVILCVSISNNAKSHLEKYHKNSNISHLPILHVSPEEGISPNLLRNGEHAWNLAYSLRNLLNTILPASCSKFHLFISSPTAFSYILGNVIGYELKNVQLYEHDFDGIKYENKYYPSFSLPK
jgi:hypothetical protein